MNNVTIDVCESMVGVAGFPSGYVHSLIINGHQPTSEQWDCLRLELEALPDVNHVAMIVRPGDDVYGYTADYSQALVWASADVSAAIKQLAAA